VNTFSVPLHLRGALDVRARPHNDEMNCGTRAWPPAREECPVSVRRAYGVGGWSSGRELSQPKPFDSRVYLGCVGRGESGDGERRGAPSHQSRSVPRSSWKAGCGKAHETNASADHKAQRGPCGLFPEATSRDLAACQICSSERIAAADPAGKSETIHQRIEELLPAHQQRSGADRRSGHLAAAGRPTWRHTTKIRGTEGVTRSEAETGAVGAMTFGSVMVRHGDADALIGGSHPALPFPSRLPD